MNDVLKYYIQHGIMTDTSVKSMIRDIPTNIEEIVMLVQNILIHQYWASKYGITVTEEKQKEPLIREFNNKLIALSKKGVKNIKQTLTADEKLVGICRDFSVIATALCREVGIPARARCGFSTYFEKNKFIDHWVFEYWNNTQNRWVMVDAQLDSLQQELLKIDFNPLDVSEEKFIIGGKAWELCRQGVYDAELFGIFEWWGFDYLKSNLILDANSLIKLPMQPWDMWEGYKSISVADWNDSDYKTIDKLASLTIHVDEDFISLKEYTDENNKIKPNII